MHSLALPSCAVITGVSKGIGKALALRFGREGIPVIGCARGRSALGQLREEWDRACPDVPLHTDAFDLADSAAVKQFGTWVLTLFPAPGVLVHNAGIFRPGSILGEAEDGLEELMRINLYSAWHLTRILVPPMVEQGRGHVFTLCSVASLQAYPGGASYAITKAALLGLTRALRAETRDTGLKVTALIPGATWSDSWAGADYPDNRLMKPEDIADMVWATCQLGPSAVVEELLIRPQRGDL